MDCLRPRRTRPAQIVVSPEFLRNPSTRAVHIEIAADWGRSRGTSESKQEAISHPETEVGEAKLQMPSRPDAAADRTQDSQSKISHGPLLGILRAERLRADTLRTLQLRQFGRYKGAAGLTTDQWPQTASDSTPRRSTQ